ncbi:patatin-like phospholipase family protein [Stieleria varia]|uniref:NTE family protein RssA n=1 Tax=Stieleria varia TaxID=2528005 RepID=A0A5C6AH05_9BACT|nr:patatin-like phospholipase family protein [Stieleria varia]TWT98465.1 NTE family protein RssA [Stieleria varia]
MKLLDLPALPSSKTAAPEPGPCRAVVTLGGGGARGLAHLGALEAIGESGVLTERIVGVSIGGLMGGLYAVHQDIYRMQAAAMQLLDSPMFSASCNQLLGSASQVGSRGKGRVVATPPSSVWYSDWYTRIVRLIRTGRHVGRLLSGPALMTSGILDEAIEQLIPDIDLQETAIPISIVAADLVSGHRIVLETGSLRKAILASTAIPGFFPPVAWGDAMLCDIGVLDSLPLTIAKSYPADLVIGVDVGSGLQRSGPCESAVEVMMRVEEIGEQLHRRHSLRHGDLIIRPDVGHRHWYDFRNPERLIEEGRRAGRRVLAELPHRKFSQRVCAPT